MFKRIKHAHVGKILRDLMYQDGAPLSVSLVFRTITPATVIVVD